jgi:nitroreductase
MTETPKSDSSTGTAPASTHPDTEGVAEWLRRSPVYRLKLRLQFTGWLQYMLPVTAAVVLLVVAGLAALLHAPTLAGTLLALAGLALALEAFDLTTTKLGWRPHEHHPPTLDHLDAFDLMRARRSTRSFQAVDLTTEDRTALLADAAAATRPGALLGTAPVRLEYVATPLTVWPVVGAHEFLVAIAPREYDRTAVVDVGRSLQHVVTAATRRGISTCWIGPGADQSSVTTALGDRFDSERDHVVCVCAVGYRSRFVPTLVRLLTWRMHRRLPLEQLFFADAALTAPVRTDLPPLSAFGRTFEACQWSPSSYNGQTTRAVVHTAGDAVQQVDFVAATPSRFYAPVALGIWVANWETGCAALGVPGRPVVLADAPDGTGFYGASWVRE